MKKKINQGIIMKGGQINATNITVGKNSVISDNEAAKKIIYDIKKKLKFNKFSTRELKELLSKNKIEEVIKILTESFELQNDDNKFNSITIITSRWNQLKENSIKGMISFEETSIETLKIINTLIQIIDENK